ncbi:MAG: hypothetical protein GWO24_36860 [Akkermansiaceae bacterium]|nr:hypothetical protein [Akkermansiaceae bacterium]
MANQEQSTGRNPGVVTLRKEVVKLPVPESDLASRLETMPTPKPDVKPRPAPPVTLIEEEAKEPVEMTPAELGVGWEDEEAGQRQTPVGWLVLIGAILIGLGGWALAKLSQGEERLDQQAESVQASWAENERETREALELLAEIERAARAYLMAGEIGEKARYVRHRERVMPLMESYYGRHGLKPAQFESIEQIRPLAIENKPFDFIEVRLAGGGNVMLFIEETPDGELKFDWEAEVAYQPMALEDYIREKPTAAMDFRVYARLDTFHAFEFVDRERYQALLLTERNSDQFLFGYIEKGTEDEVQLTRFLSRNITKGQPVLLRLRFLPGTRSHRSVLVEEMVAPRWVHVTPPRNGN